jgi:hypothetical protein
MSFCAGTTGISGPMHSELATTENSVASPLLASPAMAIALRSLQGRLALLSPHGVDVVDKAIGSSAGTHPDRKTRWTARNISRARKTHWHQVRNGCEKVSRGKMVPLLDRLDISNDHR